MKTFNLFNINIFLIKFITYSFFFSYTITTLYSQSTGQISGKVFDAKTKEPVSFVTVLLKEKKRGLYTNEEGDFTFTNRISYQSDSLVFTSIGYEKKVIAFSQLAPNKVNKIYMNRALEQLDEIVIASKKNKKRRRPKQLIREAIRRIPQNHPMNSFKLVSYYRDYLKRGASYYNLNEAIIQTVDYGFSTEYFQNRFRLIDYKKNKNFPRETNVPDKYDTIWQTANHQNSKKFMPYAKLPNNGGNEFFILLAHDPIRNFRIPSFAFIYRLSVDFLKNHTFSKPVPVFKDDLLLYKVKFSSYKQIAGTDSKPKSKGYSAGEKASFIRNGRSSGEIIGDAIIIKGEIYIRPSDFTIHKIKYTGSLKSTKKKVYELVLEYGYTDVTQSQMQLKYISFNNEFFAIDHNDRNTFKIDWQKRTSSFILLSMTAPVDPTLSKNKDLYDVFHNKRRIKLKRIEVAGNKIRIYPENLKELNLQLNVDLRNIRDTKGRVVNQKQIVRYYQYRELFVQELNKELSFEKKCFLGNIPLYKGCISIIKEKEQYLMNSPLTLESIIND